MLHRVLDSFGGETSSSLEWHVITHIQTKTRVGNRDAAETWTSTGGKREAENGNREGKMVGEKQEGERSDRIV